MVTTVYLYEKEVSMKKINLRSKLIMSILIIFLIIVVISRFVNVSVKNESISKEQWREDIKYLQEKLPKKHANLYFNETEEEFNSLLRELDANVNSLNSKEIQVQLMKIMGVIGDSHTNIANFKSNKLLPLKFYWFKDGIYIISSDYEYKDLLGFKVLKINNTPIKDYINMVAVLIPHENESLIKARFSDYIEDSKILEHFSGVENDTVSLNLLDNKGNEVLKEIKIKRNTDIKYMNLIGELSNKPLYLQNQKADLTGTYLKEEKLIYCKLNKCPMIFNKKELKNIEKIAQENKVKTIVVDLRNNSGGTYFHGNDLYNMLSQLKTSKLVENVDVIIGRETFSSGILYTLQFKEKLEAKLYGEPTGGKPSHYGDIQNMVLPNSKLNISYSTKYFSSNINGDTLNPDYEVELSIEDYIIGSDPVLQKIIDNNK